MLKGVFIALFVSFLGNAQNLVTISDGNFAAILNERYPTCMNGNQLDITCLEITNEENLNLNSMQIQNIDGIQYFTNLKVLEVLENNITSISQLPTTLVKFDCSMNQLNQLPSLPNTLEELSCAMNRLTNLPILPNSLKVLYCNFNEITNLPYLPSNLEFLACGSNKITCLPTLPKTIFIGDIALNPLACLSSHESWMDAESLKIPICKTEESLFSSTSCICISTSLLSNVDNNSSTNFVNDDTIFPNPTEGKITINSKQEILGIRVLDLKGQSVQENKLINNLTIQNNIAIDLSELENGVYFVESLIGENISTYKIVKTN